MFFARDPISFPEDLNKALHAAIHSKRKNLGSPLRTLWPKLAKQRGQSHEGEKHYSFLPEEADAYASYYLPVNSLKAALSMEESFLLGHDPAPGGKMDWLDLGTGPGTAYWGIAWWSQRHGTDLRFTGWDQSPIFTRIAKDFARYSPFGGAPNFLSDGDLFSVLKRQKPTHLSFVNSVSEIFPDEEDRFQQIEKILAQLREFEKKDSRPRYLLVVEPGSKESSRELARLKDRIQEEKIGSVLLPCLDQRRCGALRDPKDWCHEEVACEFPDWVNQLGMEAGLRKESMLFSYAWIRAGSITPLVPKGFRIVSQRMERKGQVECRLCSAEGKISARVQRSKATEENQFFFESCRGDIWKSLDLGPKGDIERAQSAFQIQESIFHQKS